ncbi:hypothetical protein PFISCL1PPCAC_28645, partial [Pristionchus fissidentatus]
RKKKEISTAVAAKYYTLSSRTFFDHLKRKHELSPKEAGIALRCDCGIEIQSTTHNLCRISNYTVVRKSSD